MLRAIINGVNWINWGKKHEASSVHENVWNSGGLFETFGGCSLEGWRVLSFMWQHSEDLPLC